MTLKTLFAIPIAVILVVTLSLAGMIAGQGWSGQERGKAAVDAVNRMRVLIDLQTNLRAERIASNLALGKPYPTPEPVKQRLADVRRETDRGIADVAANIRAASEARTDEIPPEPFLVAVDIRLASIRAVIDDLLVLGQSARRFAELSSVMPGLFSVSRLLDDPFERASLAVTTADPQLSGLVTEDRLASSLRDQIGVIAALLVPRTNAGEQLTAEEMLQLRILLAEASNLTQLLGNTIEVAGATEWMRTSFAALQAIDVDNIFSRLHDQAAPESRNGPDSIRPLLPQRLLIPWGERVSALRASIVAAMVERVAVASAVHERQFDLVLAGFGAIVFAMLESVVLLSERVVGPLALLGLAITRIAAGDRSVPLTLHSGTREITEMVTAVETLRQAALVADAAAMRRRMAAQQRMLALREALGIVQTVREPAQVLERGVARLSAGMEATIALVTTATAAAPATLGVAADAVRFGLAEMRASAAELDATFTAAGSAQEEDRPEAEFVAHILAVQAQVDRRDRVVRGFVHPSLVALRDACAAAQPPGPVLRDLVSDQFERIEETITVVASMLAAVSRASAIVQDLALDDTPLAA
jgi:hypothetical protein